MQVKWWLKFISPYIVTPLDPAAGVMEQENVLNLQNVQKWVLEVFL